MSSIGSLKKDLRKIADPKRAKNLQRFFKTEKGEYGEGDIFLGITVPNLRIIAKKYYSLDIKQLKELIVSKIHEERLIALFILIYKYKTTNHKKICFHFYIKHTKYINNWDLVDLSAPNIVGEFLWFSARSLNDSSGPNGNTRIAYDNISNSTAADYSLNGFRWLMKRSFREELRPVDILLELAQSENVWERRIAILATFQFIKYNRFDESLKIAKILLKDPHDLIHKAVGWMLREIGKRNQKTEIEFLDKYYKKMPRTTLRYAIERFPERLKKIYVQRKVIPDV